MVGMLEDIRKMIKEVYLDVRSPSRSKAPIGIGNGRTKEILQERNTAPISKETSQRGSNRSRQGKQTNEEVKFHVDHLTENSMKPPKRPSPGIATKLPSDPAKKIGKHNNLEKAESLKSPQSEKQILEKVPEIEKEQKLEKEKKD